MAKMKVKIKKSEGSSKVKTNDSPKVANTENNPDYNVRQISNGWLVRKSWSDKDGKYHTEEVYHKDNPIDENELLEQWED